jgi:hypothetical protein
MDALHSPEETRSSQTNLSQLDIDTDHSDLEGMNLYQAAWPEIQ